MRKLLLLLFCTCLASYSYAQTDTAKKLNEVTITGIQESQVKNTSIHIEPYSLEEFDAKAPFNLSDALSNIPGIGQVTTGNAISKPVIRGLYGNRILVLLSGLRFDNQQFQDEHGLGLSQIGIDRVELIKGPASLLYGTDAVGGVINVIEETPTGQGKFLDVNTRLYSNTLGTLTDIGYSVLQGSKWRRVRLGYETHADYSDGNGRRVLNSRNKGYYLKLGSGNTRKNWTQNNSYNLSFNQFGFITPDLNKFFSPDARWSRNMSGTDGGPHHIVMLNALSSQNSFALKSSVLKVNIGGQSNLRMEDEGGGEISLNMHLLSSLENARWEKSLNKNILFVVNQQFTYENNTNLGKRILIPNANMIEGNLSGFLRFYLGKVNIEAGIGSNYKHIKTYFTPPLNGPSKEIHPFSIGHITGNGMLGLSYNPNRWLNIKSNISTGDRAPNLAELSSDGLHEGYYRFELGDPNLKLEKNLNWDLTLELSTKQLFLSASGYYNRFWNYIYLAPDSLNFFGFPIYDFRQQHAKIYGAEFIVIYKPEALNWFQVKESYVATRGTLDLGGYLPFITADRNKASLMFTKDISHVCKSLFIEPEFEYVLPQDRPAQFETATGDYALINLYTGITTTVGKHDYKWNFAVHNLLDKVYHDHLSRLADPTLFNPAINNQGINFVLSLNTKLGL